jgi:phosphatidate cytidylyltransferase
MSGPMTRITLGAGLIAACTAILVADAFMPQGNPFLRAPAFWLLMVAALLVGCHEFCHMLQTKGHPCKTGLAMAFTFMLVAAAWTDTLFAGNDATLAFCGWTYMYVLVALVLGTFLAGIYDVERGRSDVGRAAQDAAWTVLVVMTVGLLGVFIAKIRLFEGDPWRGLMYLALFVGTVKMGDIGAYTVGSIMGRHKLTPTLSPKKTYEGLAGALVAGTGAALAIGCLWGGFALWQMLVFGVVVTATGVLGDLAESLLKRACGVKDSGAIPGFGGVLDILDSLLGAAPVAYLLLVVLIRHP